MLIGKQRKKRSSTISSPIIDECYETAMKNGALGGKLIGAGGGGFLMFYCKNGEKHKVIESIQKMGLKWERFHFDFDGVKILVQCLISREHNVLREKGT